MDVENPIAEKFASYLQQWQRYDHDMPPRTLLVRHVHVAETDDAARRAEPFMLEGLAGQKALRVLALKGGVEKTPEMLEIGRIYLETAKSYDFWIDEGLAFVGSPQTVARAIERQQQLCGYEVLLTHHQIPGMPSEMTTKSLRLFGERVIPEFATVSATAQQGTARRLTTTNHFCFAGPMATTTDASVSPCWSPVRKS